MTGAVWKGKTSQHLGPLWLCKGNVLTKIHGHMTKLGSQWGLPALLLRGAQVSMPGDILSNLSLTAQLKDCQQSILTVVPLLSPETLPDREGAET